MTEDMKNEVLQVFDELYFYLAGWRDFLLGRLDEMRAKIIA